MGGGYVEELESKLTEHQKRSMVEEGGEEEKDEVTSRMLQRAEELRREIDEERKSKDTRGGMAGLNPRLAESSKSKSFGRGAPVQERIAHRDLEKREAELRASYDRLLDENQNLKTAMKKRTDYHMEIIEGQRRRIETLETKLQEMNFSKSTDEAHLQKLRNINGDIVEKIEHLQTRTHERLLRQEEEMTRRHESKLKSIEKELLAERQKKEMGLDEWESEKQRIVDERNSYYEKAVRLSEMVERYKEESIDLKLKFESQEDEVRIMTRQLALLRKENDELRKSIEDMKAKMLHMSQENQKLRLMAPMGARPSASSLAGGQQRPETFEESERVHKYQEMVGRLKKLLENGKRNFTQARNAYINILSERTELEKFLRQCIEDVKEELMAQRHITHGPKDASAGSMSTQQFSLAERQQVIELLLSKERVLTLLYEKTFPHQAQLEGFDAELVGENVPFHFAPGMDSQVSQEMDFMGSHPDEEFDTGEMWSRWSETQQDHTYHH